MADTKIEYLTKTWNPIQTIIKGESGQGYHCTHVSEGCRNCWAEEMNNRFGNKLPYDSKHLEFEIKESELNKPFSWRKPQVVGVQYMSDLFHEDIRFEMILKVMNIALLNPKHTFVFLTKRVTEALLFHKWICEKEIYQPAEYPKNILFGCSVEDQTSVYVRISRLIALKQFFPNIKLWLSVEPMIKAVDLKKYLYRIVTEFKVKHASMSSKNGSITLGGTSKSNLSICLVVVGGESGKNARPMHPDWVRKIRDDCKAANVPFYFKQYGEWRPIDRDIPKELWDKNHIIEQNGELLQKVGKKKAGRLLDGIEHNEFPKNL